MTTYADTAAGFLADQALNAPVFDAESDNDSVEPLVLGGSTDPLIKRRYYKIQSGPQGSFGVTTGIEPLKTWHAHVASETSALLNCEVRFLGDVKFKDTSSFNTDNSLVSALMDVDLIFEASNWDKTSDQENTFDAERLGKSNSEPLTEKIFGRDLAALSRVVIDSEVSRGESQRLLVDFIASHARATYLPSLEKILVNSDTVLTSTDAVSAKMAGLKALKHYQALTKARERSSVESYFNDSWLNRYSKLVEQLSLLKADWDGEESVVPSADVIRSVARVARYLPAQTRNPEVEIDSSTGSVNLNWWSKDFRDCFSLVFVQAEFVIGITSSGDNAPQSWRHGVEDQRRISEEIEGSPFTQRLIEAL